jgi:hypothetical protein
VGCELAISQPKRLLHCYWWSNSKKKYSGFSLEKLNLVEEITCKQRDRVDAYESIYSDVKFIHNNELQVPYLICRRL